MGLLVGVHLVLVGSRDEREFQVYDLATKRNGVFKSAQLGDYTGHSYMLLPRWPSRV